MDKSINSLKAKTDLPVYSNGGISVSFSSSPDGDQIYIKKVSHLHTFGFSKGDITLVAWKGSKRCGALIADFGSSSNLYHSAQRSLFSIDRDDISSRAITIKRIFSNPGQWKVQGALISAILTVAKHHVSNLVSIVDGQAYEHHPGLINKGFNICVPNIAKNSYYYFYPLNLHDEQVQDALSFSRCLYFSERRKIKVAVKRIIEKRSEVKFWIAPMPAQHRDVFFNDKSWAVRSNTTNGARWTSLSSEDCVFFYKDHPEVFCGFGLVENKEKKVVPGYKNFPLWISFIPDSVVDIRVPISEVFNNSDFAALGGGGLIQISEGKGSELCRRSEIILTNGGMTVLPNPYLLHGTSFNHVPKQVFVVQSWELRDSVFPIIKSVLSTAGYSAKYAGDRDGQVVFDDIWKLMNESEAVLVDFTQKKPNVYLEYGMAIVLGKPIVAITQVKEDLPSDTPQLQYLAYAKDTAFVTLSEQLVGKMTDTIEDINRANSMI